MRISDWSSDVCSSDLFVARFFGDNNLIEGRLSHGDSARRRIETPAGPLVCAIDGQPDLAAAENGRRAFAVFRPESVARSEERRVGKECVSTFRYRGAPYH